MTLDTAKKYGLRVKILASVLEAIGVEAAPTSCIRQGC